MPKKQKIKIYVGCNLTHSPEVFKQSVEKLKNLLAQNPQFEVLKFLGQNPKFSPQEVFDYDTNCVRTCDVMVANVTYPGLGIGAEFGIAVENKKPIITIFEENALVSRFIEGYVSPNHIILHYQTIPEVAQKVTKAIQEIIIK